MDICNRESTLDEEEIVWTLYEKELQKSLELKK